jgi:NADH dehydrogenase
LQTDHKKGPENSKRIRVNGLFFDRIGLMDPLTKTTLESMDKPEGQKVLILGGGFGGIKAALELCGQSKLEITLMSDSPNFRYYPMLYRTATGGSKIASSIPLREILGEKGVKIVHDSAKDLDRAKKEVKCSSGKAFSYDILIVALGSVTNYFGVKGLKEYSFGIKSNEDAQELRDHLHKQLMDDKQPDLNYVVIGGGPSGVELAGVLPAYINHIMRRHGLEKRGINVDIVEGEKRLMPRMSEKYSAKVARRLQKLGVKLYLGQRVLAETAKELRLSGRTLDSQTVIWTAGVATNPFITTNGFKLSEHGKAVVDEYLRAEDDIFVIGDNADTPYSGMAQTALYDGVYIGSYLKRRAAGKQLKAYMPKRPVYVTPVGPQWAAVAWGEREFFGFIGWVLRRFADLKAYHDYEPWWQASKHWMAFTEGEESCPVCSKK